jgi:hypothetical protein
MGGRIGLGAGGGTVRQCRAVAVEDVRRAPHHREPNGLG